jgi:hypothetical protein
MLKELKSQPKSQSNKDEIEELKNEIKQLRDLTKKNNSTIKVEQDVKPIQQPIVPPPTQPKKPVVYSTFKPNIWSIYS